MLRRLRAPMHRCRWSEASQSFLDQPAGLSGRQAGLINHGLTNERPAQRTPATPCLQIQKANLDDVKKNEKE
jgi:hypothetical protein